MSRKIFYLVLVSGDLKMTGKDMTAFPELYTEYRADLPGEIHQWSLGKNPDDVDVSDLQDWSLADLEGAWGRTPPP